MIWKDMSLKTLNVLTKILLIESQTSSKSCKTIMYFFETTFQQVLFLKIENFY